MAGFFAATLVLVFIVVVVLAILVVIVGLRRSDGLEQLGVKPVYPEAPIPAAKIDAYLDLKEKFRAQYAKGLEKEEAWMGQLPIQAKELLKFRLMQRAIGGMAALQKIDADARGYWRLFSQGVITKQFWNSVVEAEREVSNELEQVKAEAFHLEPSQDPRGIISEAMQFLVRYGDRLPGPEEVAGSADSFVDAIKNLPSPPALPGLDLPGGLLGRPAGVAGGLVPSPLGFGPPLGPPGGAKTQPAPQDEGVGDSYRWKQDSDEVEVSVSVPETAVKSNVKVVIQARTLRVLHGGQPLVDGELAAFCNPEGSTWTLARGQVTVSLEKKDSRPWPSLFSKKPP